ncbi:hypothetical protein RHGRI_024438 [Rhododendron griersonianum]|uniref:Cytochrome P450 n=1 Tax=Rhododendron griersonianum TaxID=479676 RepID=A0AAV6JBR7_9ERIC|nr:hypothetical protein RHGRI_024438 [Rhododendron griersonianum]
MLLRDFNTLTGSVDIGNFVPCLGWVNWVTGVDAKIDRVAKGFDEFLEGLVEERLKLDTDDGDNGEGNNNFLDMLLQIYKDNSAGISFDRDCLKAQIMVSLYNLIYHGPTIDEWKTTSRGLLGLTVSLDSMLKWTKLLRGWTSFWRE